MAVTSLDRIAIYLKQQIWIPYFFCYKTEFYSFQNKPKNLDPSYKMDLDL